LTKKFLSIFHIPTRCFSEWGKQSLCRSSKTYTLSKKNLKKNVFYHSLGTKYTVTLVNKKCSVKEVIFKVNGVLLTPCRRMNKQQTVRGQGVSGITILCIGGEKDKQQQRKPIPSTSFRQHASHKPDQLTLYVLSVKQRRGRGVGHA